MSYVAFRPSASVGTALAIRPGGTSQRAVVALRRYFYLVRKALVGLEFTEAEARLIVDTLRGGDFVAPLIPSLWDSAVSAVRRRALDPRHGVDRDALVAKLRAARPVEMVAIIDAVERYWCSLDWWSGPEEALGMCGLTWGWERRHPAEPQAESQSALGPSDPA